AIAQLAISLRSLQVVLGNPDIPFLGENLAELGNWSDKISKLFTDNGLSSAANPLDITIDDLESKGLASLEDIIDELAGTLGVSGSNPLNLDYSAGIVRFTIDIADDSFFHATPTAGLNVAEELARVGVKGLQLGGGASVAISPSYGISLTVGLDLRDTDTYPKTRPITDRIFIEPGSGPELQFFAPIDANLELSGTIGMLGLSLEDSAGGNIPLLRTTAGNSGPMVAVDLTATGDGHVTLTEIFDSVSSIGGSVLGNTITVSGTDFSLFGTLDVAIPTFTLNASAQIGTTTIGGGEVSFGWADLTVGSPSISTNTDFNDDFMSFNVSSNDPLALFSAVLEGIDAALGLIEDLNGSAVDTKIPVLGLSLADVTTFVDGVQDAINALASDPSATLTLMELTVERAVIGALDQLDGTIDLPAAPTLPSPGDPAFQSGTPPEFDLSLYSAAMATYIGDLSTYVSTQGNFVTLSYDAGSRSFFFDIDLGICSDKVTFPSCKFAYPISKKFSLDLSDVTGADFSSIVAAEAAGNLDLDYQVAAAVHLGVELPTVTAGAPGSLPTVTGTPKLFIRDSSGLTASIEGSATGTFNASIGPFGVEVGTTTAFAESGADCSNSTDDDGDGVVNDGCPQSGATAEADADCTNATDDDTADADGFINDGCPAADNQIQAEAGADFALTGLVSG
ncbi:MAG: hypothetical protein ACKOYO_09930, partial [Actinomycetota bacterium]